LNISVKLFPPFKFSNGKQINNVEVNDDSRLSDLLNLLEAEGIFDIYGKNSLLAVTDNKMINNNYILHEGQIIEILLVVDGG